MDVWADHELNGGEFPDQRLKTRLAKLLGDLGRKIGETVPTACQDWAATKAAYRFFSNQRVDESIILAGHFSATKARFAKTSGQVLVLHDTTEFSFKRNGSDEIGKLSLLKGRHKEHTLCGLLMHSSLVLTTEGTPLGLAAVKFWTRKKFKGTNALKKKVNITRIPIEQKESFRRLENLRLSTQQLGEPSRCVHVGDRESDIFELFCTAKEEGTDFLVRTCVDRLAGRGSTTISKKMEREPIKGEHEVEVRDNHGRLSTIKVYLRFCEMTVHPPIGKQSRYPALTLTVIHAHERGTPAGREPIQWKLLTNCSVNNVSSAIEKLDWYAQRWKLETFHKVLKSGCQAEQSKLRTAERLTNLLAVLCIIGWRVFWLTMVNRATPQAPAETVLTTTETEILDRIEGNQSTGPKQKLGHYLKIIAKLGGYLARANDPPPGNMVLWRGLSRLTDIQIGFELRERDVGN